MVEVTAAEPADGSTTVSTQEEPLEAETAQNETTDNGEEEEKEAIVGEKPPIDTSNIVYKNVYKKEDEETRKAVLDLFNDELGDNMPEQVKQHRLELLCVVAFDGERAIGVSTISMEASGNLWVKVGFFRCLVREDYRKKGVATKLAVECKKALQAYADEHPGEQIKAMGAYTHIKHKQIAELCKKPVWEPTGLTIVGYNESGFQVRLAWLDNAVVKY